MQPHLAARLGGFETARGTRHARPGIVSREAEVGEVGARRVGPGGCDVTLPGTAGAIDATSRRQLRQVIAPALRDGQEACKLLQRRELDVIELEGAAGR